MGGPCSAGCTGMADVSPLPPTPPATLLQGFGPGDGLADVLCMLHREHLCAPTHGDYPAWCAALGNLPALQPTGYDFSVAAVTIGRCRDADASQRRILREGLRALMPWRKGPFSLFGVVIDAEWRSERKWNRLLPHISPLRGRRVLDVGCGNGYYLWRMFGAGARLALGLDPGLLQAMQFFACQRYAAVAPVHMLPLRLTEFLRYWHPEGAAACRAAPGIQAGFDTVFCMGVLSHQRCPEQLLADLRHCLRPGGELVLETLVVRTAYCLNPARDGSRYAQMKNIHCLPSVDWLLDNLTKAGFVGLRVLDIGRTGVAEQRSTEWMRFHSLADFLGPQDYRRTIEGYPAPTRALLLAEAPRD